MAIATCNGVLARQCGGAVHPHVVAGTRDPFPCCERCAAFALAIGFDIRPYVPRVAADRRRRRFALPGEAAGRRFNDAAPGEKEVAIA